MPKFVYQVRDARGAPSRGTLAAGSLEDASRMLRGEGNVIIELREQTGVDLSSDSRAPASRARVNRDDVIFFANQLAVMVETGVPLPDAMDGIAEQAANVRFRRILTDVSERVKAGTEFSAALMRYPKLFGSLFVSLVKASEASGTLGKMLQRASRYLEKERQVRRRVKGAAAYPVAMLCFCVLVVIGMLTFVLPRFEKIYAGKHAVLPAPTRLLLALSDGLVSNWPFVILGLAGTGVAGYLFFSRAKGRIMLDRFRLDMPVLGGMFRRACLARSLRTLATMVSSGVSMLESLEITAEVAGNYHYRRIWMELSGRLKEGASLSEEMCSYDLIPRSISQMVGAGEKTGRLGAVLERVAEFCEEELDTAIKTATTFIEPVMIVIMGAIVGGIAMALLLPVFSLSRIVATG